MFESDAANLVLGDTNGTTDVFVRDRARGTTVRVSRSSGGTQGNDASYSASISGGGRFVVFISDASNLVGGDTNGVRDAFLHDLSTHATTRLSRSKSGAQSNGITHYVDLL